MDVKVLSKEERIIARRKRIEQRKQQKDDSSIITKPSENQNSEQRLPKLQIAKSRDTLNLQREIGDEKLSDVILKSDLDHQNIVEKWNSNQRIRENEISEMKNETSKWNESIKARWESFSTMKVPQELYKRVQKQQSECDDLVERKNEVINKLNDELKAKDAEYDTTLQKYDTDVNKLIELMRLEFDGMLSSQEQHLKLIEEKYKEEREEILKNNREELNILFEKRRDMELNIMKKKLEQEEAFQDELTMIRAKDAEEYNNLKIVLENNVQLLEQQLEEMRATYQLNSEKLDYNHRVLKERDLENKQTVQHHKQKLKRLKESLSTAMARHTKLEEQYKSINQDLLEDYQRMTEQYKEMQRKYRHFQLYDTKKYREVWEMNEELVMDLVHKLLKADRIIHNDLLGQNYNEVPLPKHQFSTINPIHTSSNVISETVQSMHRSPKPGTLERFSNTQIRQVMLLLAAEASFIVPEKMRNAIEDLPEDEQAMYMVDNILAALGVVDREDLEELVSKFYDDTNSTVPSIGPNGVVGILREFTNSQSGTNSSRNDTHASTSNSDIKRREMSSAQKSKKKHKQESNYWYRLGHIVPNEHLELWQALEKRLAEYDNELQSRENIVEECQNIAKENEELRATLKSYLSDPKNDDLQIPPNRLIRID